MLWQKLKRDQLGFPCRRQTSIAKYVVDFVFPARRLIIELDGVQHEEQQEYDNERDALLASLGYRVIRFQNHEVIQGIDKVLERISQELQST
jgi:very-short-patch-repair endonuclease